MSRVLVLGSVNADFTIRIERLPAPGETVSGGTFFTSRGGKGANQAVAAARAGARVHLIAKLGRDSHGEHLAERLAAAGIACEGILFDKEQPTGSAFIFVDRLGNNQIAVASGANHHLHEEDLGSLKALFADTQVLLSQLEIPLTTVTCGLKMAKSLGLRTILNAAPILPLPPEVWTYTDILVLNQLEAATLLGFPLPDLHAVPVAARSLLRREGQEAIITFGGQGALWVHKDGATFIPPFPVTAVDTTGAGDAFCGTLAAILAEGQPMAEALRYASAAGALATTVLGAQDSLPFRAQIEALLSKHN